MQGSPRIVKAMGTLAILFLCAAVSLVGCKGPDFSRRYSAMGVKHPELDPHVPIYGGLRLGLKPTGFMSPGLGVGLADMIANKLADKRLAAIEQTMTQAQIQPAEIVRARFLEHIARFADIVQTDGDALFQI